VSNGRRVNGCLVSLTAVAVLGAVIVGTVVLTRASVGGPTSARVGQAQPTGSVIVRVTPGQILPARQWPTACQFLADDEIRSILPDAAEIHSTPNAVSTRSIEEFAADPSYQEPELAPEGRCVWDLKLPGERINALTFVSLAIIAVGDPELIARYHDNQQLGRGAGVGPSPVLDGTSCYLSSLYGAGLVCARGPVMYEVGGSTTTDFGSYRAYSFWRDTVLREFADTVAAKIKVS
jgi:hypothetical protein